MDWDGFRNLCRYYIDCIELESGGRVEVSVGEAERGFVSLDHPVDWVQLNRGAAVVLEASERMRAMVARERRQDGKLRFRIGGPVELVPASRGRPDRMVPVFLVSVVLTRERDSILLRAEMPPRVNEAWLDARFPKSRMDQREGLLIQLGLLREQVGVEGLELTASEGSDVGELWRSLLRVEGRRFLDRGGPEKPCSQPALGSLRKPGLYNRALLLAPSSTSYTGGLLEELRKLSGRSDKELRQTALAPFFEPDGATVAHPGRGVRNPDPHAHPEFQPLNAEQREVLELSFHKPLVAVQGPPGTGKSTVVTHVMTGHALTGQSVLFASRNHRALDAVVPRIEAMHQERPLILRLTPPKDAKGEQGADWLERVLELLARPANPELGKSSEASQLQLEQAHEQRAHREAELRAALERTQALAAINDSLEAGLAALPLALQPVAEPLARSLDVEELEGVAKMLTGRGWVASQWLRRKLALRRLRRLREHIENGQPEIELILAKHISTQPGQAVAELLAIARLGLLWTERAAIEQSAAGARPWKELVNALKAADEDVLCTSKGAIEAFAGALGSQLSESLKRRLVDLRGELAGRTTVGRFHRLSSGVRGAIEASFGELTRVFPLWACSSLSARSRLPFVPAAFDLVVIDEASQCDIASCLPLLFRAKRALISGDPMQLQHVGKVSKEVDVRLRQFHGVNGVDFGRFRYSVNSIWDPAFAVTQGPQGETRMLKEHWRCHPAIAGCFSKLFYEHALRLRTPEEQLKPVQRGDRKLRGIEWTLVPGGSEVLPGGSRYHAPQIEAIIVELKRVAKTGYDGTVGVVTPFRAHANRIRDAVHCAFPKEQLHRWRFVSETADGFQGDERDLILFGLVGGPDPEDVPPFYKRDDRRFNVAISRARSLLHVFGDHRWAAASGQRVLAELVAAWRGSQQQAQAPARSDLIGPVWEPRFAAAMRDAAIEFHQQYRACGFYLDFAVRGGPRFRSQALS